MTGIRTFKTASKRSVKISPISVISVLFFFRVFSWVSWAKFPLPEAQLTIDNSAIVLHDRTMSQTAAVSGDLEIIRQVLDGDVNAFELLLKKYQEHVLTIVKKRVPYEQIEETAHDVFVRAYQGLPSFKNTSAFKHWLAAIAVRTCYDFWRERYRSRELPMSSLTEQQQQWLENRVANQSDHAFANQEGAEAAREVLDWALGKLSAEDRMVVELVYLEELSGKEAAELLGWSVANVKIRSFRARKKLEKLVTRQLQPRIDADVRR